MIRVWIVFILLVAALIWGVAYFVKKRKHSKAAPAKSFAALGKLNEIWIQLYETDSLEELTILRMRLGEEDLDFTAFEQGKRGTDGSIPKKYGIIISKGHLSRGQSILSKVLS